MSKVIDRRDELEILRRFVDSIPAGPCALLFEGEPGIGKSTLWRAGVDLARARSFRNLTCRSAESEAGLSYAGLADLLDGVSDEALRCLPEPQRAAIEVALVRAEPGPVPIDHRTVAAGALGVLRWMAATGPVLVALDDPQWMDVASREALAYVLRRLSGEPIGILSAVRVGERLDDPLVASDRFQDDRVQRVEVGPLPEEALDRLLRERLGTEPSGSTVLELHTVSGGNPLFALEICRATLAHPSDAAVYVQAYEEAGRETADAIDELASRRLGRAGS